VFAAQAAGVAVPAAHAYPALHTTAGAAPPAHCHPALHNTPVAVSPPRGQKNPLLHVQARAGPEPSPAQKYPIGHAMPFVFFPTGQ
jgi:hypothetical protein